MRPTSFTHAYHIRNFSIYTVVHEDMKIFSIYTIVHEDTKILSVKKNARKGKRLPALLVEKNWTECVFRSDGSQQNYNCLYSIVLQAFQGRGRMTRNITFYWEYGESVTEMPVPVATNLVVMWIAEKPKLSVVVQYSYKGTISNAEQWRIQAVSEVSIETPFCLLINNSLPAI